MNCPRCGSEKVHKKGINAGKQRYRCTNCEANFCLEVKYKSAPKYLKDPDKVCLYCGSMHIIRDGKLPSGKQRYKCVDCGKDFSDGTTIKEPEPNKFCPYCGSSLRNYGYSKLGFKRYYCKSCNRSCTENAEGVPQRQETFRDINTSVTCPSCSSKNIRLAGSRDGRRKYSCKDCGRIFIEGAQVSRHSKTEIENILNDIFMGYDIKEVAKKFNTSVRNLQGIIKNHYKEEKISKRKKELITLYGYHFKVPINYLAEYLKCSIRACEEILQDYERKVCVIKPLKVRQVQKIENFLKNA